MDIQLSGGTVPSTAHATDSIRNRKEQQFSYMGHKLSVPDSKKLDAMCEKYFSQGDQFLDVIGASNREKLLFPSLQDRYCTAMRAKASSQRPFMVSKSELNLIDKFQLATQAGASKNRASMTNLPLSKPNQRCQRTTLNRPLQLGTVSSAPQHSSQRFVAMTHRQQSPKGMALQSASLHQHMTSQTKKISHPTQNPIHRLTTEILQKPDKFKSLTVDQQIEVLTSLQAHLLGDLLDHCSVNQRNELSLHPQMPECCWPVLNIRLVENALWQHTSNKAGGMYRHNNNSQLVNESYDLFSKKRVPDSLLENPKLCAQLICKLQRKHEFLKQIHCTEFGKARFSSYNMSEVQGKMQQILNNAKSSMGNSNERDLFSVCLRVMKYAYESAPRERAK